MTRPNSPATFSGRLQETGCETCGGKKKVQHLVRVSHPDGTQDVSPSLESCPRCQPDPNPKDMPYRVAYSAGPFNTDWYEHRYFRFRVTAWLFASWWTFTHPRGFAYVQERQL